MPLLVNELSVWEIAHRWAGYDPARFRLSLPLEVRDYSRVLIAEIYHGHLRSLTLQMDKWSPEDGEDMKPYFIRHHLDDIWACIAGKRASRALP